MESSVISSINVDEEHVIHPKSNNTEIQTFENVNDIVDEFFKSPFSRYQNNLETSMRESDFIFNSVQLLYYKCYKTNFRCDGSYNDSSDWIKYKKTTINSRNKDDKCFQYAATVALNYDEIKLHPEGVSNIKPFINKQKWKGINCSSKTGDWKRFEKTIQQLL